LEQLLNKDILQNLNLKTDGLLDKIKDQNFSQVFRIRIPIGSDFDQVSGSGSRRAKITRKNIKKLRNFMCGSAGCSLLMAEGSLVAWTSFMEAY
jgi:hypothetical protein